MLKSSLVNSNKNLANLELIFGDPYKFFELIILIFWKLI